MIRIRVVLSQRGSVAAARCELAFPLMPAAPRNNRTTTLPRDVLFTPPITVHCQSSRLADSKRAILEVEGAAAFASLSIRLSSVCLSSVISATYGGVQRSIVGGHDGSKER